jgi:hypothetical protein
MTLVKCQSAQTARCFDGVSEQGELSHNHEEFSATTMAKKTKL